MYYVIFGKRIPNICAIFEFQSIEQNNKKTTQTKELWFYCRRQTGRLYISLGKNVPLG
jgi:hypothetical protein